MSSPDSVQLLAEYGARLDAVHSQPELRLALQLEMVDQADRGARELLEELESRYFASNGNTESTQQSRVWGLVSLYCAQLEAAYMHLARQFQTYSQGWAEVGDKIPMVVARATRATSMRLKWQLMRYLPVEKDIWQTLSQLWAFVEDKGLAQARVVVYEDKSTLPREFLKPMMLSVSAADSLPAQEVDIAYRVIDHLSDRFELRRHPAKGCNFFVDIDRWQRTDAQQTWKALLLPSHSGGNSSLAEVSLLLPAGRFVPDSSLEMEVYGTSYVLEPRILLEHGSDFEAARYRIVQRAS